jgi:hypothetical protein
MSSVGSDPTLSAPKNPIPVRKICAESIVVPALLLVLYLTLYLKSAPTR